jgi:DNA-directed RNA polymerase subunit L
LRFANKNSSIINKIKSRIIKNELVKFINFKIKHPKTNKEIKRPLLLLFRIKPKRENMNKNKAINTGNKIVNCKLPIEN